jgi:predicted ATP-grasp superfamily ATP-dependent carboligase
MILGNREDGRADRVLEVNPRLTTSFVGLTQGYAGGLLAPLLAQAAGRPVRLGSCREDACQFLLSP